MFRVMLILGLLVLVPAAIVFWRMRDRAVVAPPPPSGPQKVIGASILHPIDPRPRKGVDLSPNRSE